MMRFDDDLLPLVLDYFSSGAAAEDREAIRMSISEKLAWEIQAQNDRGEASARQRMALEIAYGVASQLDKQPDLFRSVMASVAEQVTDKEMQRLLRLYTGRGLKQ